MGRLVHFEIHAEDPARAAKFYGDLLGWTFQKWDGPMEYWMISSGPKEEPGIDGGLMKRHGPPPVDMQAVNAFVCTAYVENLDTKLEKLATLGGTMALPKMPVPGVGWLAYAKDTEGNIFGMMQADPNAK
jgi:predicted enzyme related to lactoylglutathione lyase